MFAEGSRYQEQLCAVGGDGKFECLVPGPGRFGPAPVPQLIVSPRKPPGPRLLEILVDPRLLEAGDHNGSTYFEHARFTAAVREQGKVEVTLQDGWWAVVMGLARPEIGPRRPRHRSRR
ncbi:hypothetical protein NKJ95_20925 [Mesorhizobium sp. M0012]|uniref:hypothetical protein n=1 Tax=Mesorhizobium sp. M0012 TaxID=2956840 RepID=UPI0033357F74